MSYYDSLELLAHCEAIGEADLINIKQHDIKNNIETSRRSRSSSVSSTYSLPNLEFEDQHEYLNNDQVKSSETTSTSLASQQSGVREQPRPRKYRKHNSTSNFNYNQSYIPVSLDTLSGTVTINNFSSTAESANFATRILVDSIANEGAKGIDLSVLKMAESSSVNNAHHGVEIANKIYNKIVTKEYEKQKLKDEQSRAGDSQKSRPSPSTVLPNGFTIQNYTDALARLIESKALNLPNITPDQILNLVQSPAFQNNKMITELVRQTVNMKK